MGVLGQFLVLPFLGFCTVYLFDLQAVVGIMLIATMCSPGGAYSNWWCSLFNADLALSVAMTACSTVVSLGAMPLNVLVYVGAAYGTSVSFNWWNMLLSLALTLVSIAVGIAFGQKFPSWRSRLNTVGNLAGAALVVFAVLTSSRRDPLWDKDPAFYLAVALPFLLGLLLTLTLAWCCGLEGPQRVTVTVETCYQNTGVALTLALVSLPPEDQSAAAGVPLFYGLVEALLLPIFLLISWRLGMTYAPKNERIHRVLLKNYQPRGPKQAPVAETAADVSRATDTSVEPDVVGQAATEDGRETGTSVEPDVVGQAHMVHASI